MESMRNYEYEYFFIHEACKPNLVVTQNKIIDLELAQHVRFK